MERRRNVLMDNRQGASIIATNNDIILGRGRGHVTHPGNIRFYEHIEAYLPAYEVATSRGDKTNFVQSIFDSLSSQSRFVLFDRATASFTVANEKAAKCKIGHAIRYQMDVRRQDLEDAARLLLQENEDSNKNKHQAHSPTEGEGSTMPLDRHENGGYEGEAEGMQHEVQQERGPEEDSGSKASSSFCSIISSDIIENTLGPIWEFDIQEDKVKFEPLVESD